MARFSIYLLPALLLFQLPLLLFAQQPLSGKAYDKSTDSVIAGVSIWNLTRGRGSVTNSRGEYQVEVRENDRLVFSHQGYRNDTVQIDFSHLKLGYNPTMIPEQQTLATVYVDESYYQRDSLQRRIDNQEVWGTADKKLVSRSGPTDGVGIALSPASFYSKKNRELKRTKARLQQEEEQAYVDFRFSESLVGYLTKLKGQDLQDFMLSYRPDYNFCRKTTKEKMQEYILAKLELYHASRHTGAKP